MLTRNPRYRHEAIGLASALLLTPATAALAQTLGTVMNQVRIGDGDGGFTGDLDVGDDFGISTAILGDLDGDGVLDLAVGARSDDDGGADRGAVWVLFLNEDGTVKAEQKISATDGGFTGRLDRWDRFGVSAAALGDVDGDGFMDLAVGASGDDDGGINRGAAWILFLNADGTVKETSKISDTQGGFFGRLDSNDLLGAAVAGLGDLNGDDVPDLAIGAPFDDDGGTNRGAVWLLFLNSNGTVQSYTKISATQGGFTGRLDRSDWFGEAIANIGDVDGDGITDLAVGARGDDDGGSARGAVWILFLNADGTVKSHQKISATQGGFTGALDAADYFGNAVAAVEDLDADGVVELAVGAFFDDDGGESRGAAWMLFLNADGTVKSHQKISSTEGGFLGPVSDGALFGSALGAIGDLSDDGTIEIAVGAWRDDGIGTTWVLSLDALLQTDCPADLNRDGLVTHEDLDPLFEAWGPCVGCPEDLTEDGMVGFDDLLVLLRAWGSCDPDQGSNGARAWSRRSTHEIRRFLRQTGPPRTKGSRGRRSLWHHVNSSRKHSGRAHGPHPETLDGHLRWQIVRHGLRLVRKEYRDELKTLQRQAREEAHRRKREERDARKSR